MWTQRGSMLWEEGPARERAKTGVPSPLVLVQDLLGTGPLSRR